MFRITRAGESDRTGDPAAGRNKRERDVKQLLNVALRKRCGFQRGGEELRINAFPLMIAAGVAVRKPDRPVRRSGKETRPDFRPYPCAVAPLPVAVADASRHRRQNPHADVVAANSVFVPRTRNVIVPVFGKTAFIQPAHALALHRGKPDKLKIKIVVRERFPVDFGRIKLNIVHCPVVFPWSAKRSADGLAIPAAQDFIAVLLPGDGPFPCFRRHHAHSFLLFYNYISKKRICQRLKVYTFYHIVHFLKKVKICFFHFP